MNEITETTIEKIIRITGRKPVSCQCALCKSQCQRTPCLGTPQDILALIERVNQKYGNTIVIVTHNDAIKNMADQIVKLKDGQIQDVEMNAAKVPAEQLEW